MRGSRSILTGGNILSLDYFGFHAVKTKMPVLGIFVWFVKNSNGSATNVCNRYVCDGKLYLTIMRF